jgi:acetyl-CoA acetyltransferase
MNMLYEAMTDIMASDIKSLGEFSISDEMFRVAMTEAYRDAAGMTTEQLAERFAADHKIKWATWDKQIGVLTFKAREKGATA